MKIKLNKIFDTKLLFKSILAILIMYVWLSIGLYNGFSDWLINIGSLMFCISYLWFVGGLKEFVKTTQLMKNNKKGLQDDKFNSKGSI